MEVIAQQHIKGWEALHKLYFVLTKKNCIFYFKSKINSTWQNCQKME